MPWRVLGVCLLLAGGIGPVQASDVPSPAIRSELRSVVLHLAHLQLAPGQATHVDDDHIALVSLASTNFVGDVRRSTGAVVPYLVEGPGSFVGFYVALCDIAETDPQDIGYDETWHPDIRLIGFAQFDNHVRAIPRWAEATVSPGLVTVPVDFHNCEGHHGIVSIRVNANHFGPNIEMTRDAGATLGPDDCRSH